MASNDILDNSITNGDSTYALLQVSDYDGNGKGSYLRLGAVDPTIKAEYQAIAAGTKTVAQASWASTTGEDLASLVMSFIDDTRDRGSSSADKFYTMSNAARAAETELLHTKGGWRDHTDGNRVVTTRGDKIEVIRGNYKQLVLGRKQWDNDDGVGLNFESSGGISYHYDEVPGQIVDVRWSDDDGTWRVFEETDSGHTVVRYHGVMKEWMRGGDVVDRIGTRKAFDSEVGSNSDIWVGEKIFGSSDDFDSDSDFDKPSDASHTADFNWPSSKTLHDVREEVYAAEVYEKTIANKLIEHAGSHARWVDKLKVQSHAKTFEGITDYENFLSVNYATGITAEGWWATYHELFFGGALSIKAGTFFDIRLGAALEWNFGAWHTTIALNFAMQVNLEASLWWHDICLGIKLTEVHNAPIESEMSNAPKIIAGMSKSRLALACLIG